MVDTACSGAVNLWMALGGVWRKKRDEPASIPRANGWLPTKKSQWVPVMSALGVGVPYPLG